ncbi:hypothetical protein Mapa_008425 [Marchantia paleacea]|nr:hypothetical protein Mapa_008425 [Marchantia paleacea]
MSPSKADAIARLPVWLHKQAQFVVQNSFLCHTVIPYLLNIQNAKKITPASTDSWI